MTRPMVTFGSAFLTAMLAVSFFPSVTIFPVVFLLLSGLLLTLFLRRSVRRAVLRTVFAAAIAGCFCFGCWTARYGFDFASLAGSAHRLAGTVEGVCPTSSGKRLAVTLRVTSHDIPSAPMGFGAIAYVPIETPADFGDTVEIGGTCLAMSSVPGFDMAGYYLGEGIRLTLSSYEEAAVTVPETRPLSYYPRDWNRRLCGRADRLYIQPYSGMVRAVLLGDTSQMDKALYTRFSRVGITHMFVVSGMHVSLMAGAVFLLCRRLPSRLRAVLGCAAAWGFVALTGFGLPALRAGVMATVLLAGRLFRRPADALNSLFLAGVLIAGANPAAILSGSFQLSMTATLGVVLLVGPISERLTELFGFRGRAGRFFSGLLGCSFGSNLGMFPFLWKLFQGISLAFPLANLLILPFLPVLLAAAAVSLAVPIPAVAELAADLVRGLLWLTGETARLLAGIHPLYLGLDESLVGVWLPLAGMAVLTALALRRPKLAARTTAFLFALLLLTLGLCRGLERDTVEVTPVYSFEGLSVVIRRGTHAAVVGLTDDGQVDRTVEALLRKRNVWTVDDLILTYGGPAELSDTAFLSEMMGVGRVFVPAGADYAAYAGQAFQPSAGVYALREGHGFDLQTLPGGGLMEVYRGREGMAVRLTTGGVRTVLTGSADLAAKLECEILLYSGKNLEKIKKIPLKYVILLCEPDAAEPLPSGVVPGWEEPLRLCLTPEGTFRVGE